MTAVAAAPQPPPDRERQARALQAGARPLIALATQLHRAVPQAPEGMKGALALAVDRFERELAAAGWDERGLSAASWVLCSWIDEVVDGTPWGAGGAGLLERFHGERGGSDRMLRLLSRLAEHPEENRALLTLFHACMSLGLNGRLRSSPDERRRLELLRTRLYKTLPREDATLSPPWRTAVAPPPPPWRRRVALAALLLLGLAAIGVYTSSRLILASRVDGVFASMQKLAPADAAAPVGAASAVPAAVPATVPRLAPLLESEIAAGRLSVRDEAHRSVVTVLADALFPAGSTQPSDAGAALLGRVAAVLARQGGKVLVVGHTDGSDERTARLPSAWHQSYEWAREAAAVLGRSLPAARVEVEAAADLQPPREAAVPRRRVDIVLYP